MTSSYSPDLRLELMATGDQSGTWGDTTNTNLGTLLEQAICGVLSVAEGDTTLTLTALNGAADQARNAVVNLTGAMTGARNVVVPTSNKLYLVKNSTTGGFAVTVKTATGSGVAIAAGTSQWVYCDGTNVVQGLVGGFTPDTNNNLSVNNLFNGFTTTATAASTTTLTIASTAIQVFTGSSTQTVVLPTTSIPAGGQYTVVNNSTGAVTVQSSGTNTITVLAAGTSGVFTAVVATPTTAANWDAQYLGVVAASGKSVAISNSLTLAGTDGTTMTFPSTSATLARTDAANTFLATQTIAPSAATALLALTAPNNTLRGQISFNQAAKALGQLFHNGDATADFFGYVFDDSSTSRNWLSVARATGVANFPVQLQEAGNRVYSAGNPPPVSGQPIPTSSTYAVGFTAVNAIQTSGGSAADGATVSGSAIKVLSTSLPAQTGTWTNRSGISIANGAVGVFVRTA